MLYGVKVYIKPEDVLNKLSEEDQKRFNKCVFTDVRKEPDGVEISCLLFNDKINSEKVDERRYRLFKENDLTLPLNY